MADPRTDAALPEFGEHEGCNYRAAKVNGSHGPAWLCNKCGWAEMIRPTLLDKANAEIERLREALHRVTEAGCDECHEGGCEEFHGPVGFDWGLWCQACLAAFDARAALTAPEASDG